MTIHFIGAGPGAADLLTVRATRLIAASGVVIYAGTYLDAEVLSHASPGADLVDSQRLNLDDIIEVCQRAHADGKDVARLCSGDPSVYSALAEQTRRLDRAGVPWDVCPGVPAYAAAAALLGRELTVPEVAQTVTLTRAQARSTRMPETETIENVAQVGGTVVLHLAIRHVRRLAEALAAAHGAETPAVVVARASQPEQQILRGTLADIADQVDESGLTQAAVVLVGTALGSDDFIESHLYRSRRD
ncbi:cobalt-precorrin-4/precorrin-4 C(11)-methyltransferase [Propioniferax innocua]|uniref:Precorrin-4/cobalt-precorrin-4 C11-methyltransferase n=1 Tax=Propioniferax innocua TaxID=1753 RepID=A0A542ZCR1_9ACTN|nr:SAM-dependent methyltransferase [Propioniferax innocua]TQL58143.1 precorrin-4/cobalt-precorrin-4 C11-methyltransferase [Propioniferax innocua]